MQRQITGNRIVIRNLNGRRVDEREKELSFDNELVERKRCFSRRSTVIWRFDAAIRRNLVLDWPRWQVLFVELLQSKNLRDVSTNEER